MISLRILTDPAIIIILTVFLSIAIYTFVKLNFVNKNLRWFVGFLKKYKKSDLAFRFGEFDKTMSSHPYFSHTWLEFRNTLLFSESIAMKKQNSTSYENLSQLMNNIQTTVDPIYFFNEETLITSRFNYKFVQVAPTLLTGMGPLFTFLNIAIAFTKVNFDTPETTMSTISSLMGSMQIAALCSVLAVGASLIFLFYEKLTYNQKCKKYIFEVQNLMYGLFDNISSEKFLIELLRETKIQNNNMSNFVSALPQQFKDSFDKSIAGSLAPYFENLIFGVNTLNDTVKSAIAAKKMPASDIVDDLF